MEFTESSNIENPESKKLLKKFQEAIYSASTKSEEIKKAVWALSEEDIWTISKKVLCINVEVLIDSMFNPEDIGDIICEFLIVEGFPIPIDIDGDKNPELSVEAKKFIKTIAYELCHSEDIKHLTIVSDADLLDSINEIVCFLEVVKLFEIYQK